MTNLQKILTRIKTATIIGKDGDMNTPFMIEIPESMADEEVIKALDIDGNGRAIFMGIIIQTISGINVYQTYEDKFGKKE